MKEKSKTMALYKYSQVLQAMDNTEFDKLYPPGATTAWSGVYRCEGCTREIVHTVSHPLPPQNHHQHTAAQGQVRWRLVVTDAAS
jgi:hypothetical protein